MNRTAAIILVFLLNALVAGCGGGGGGLASLAPGSGGGGIGGTGVTSSGEVTGFGSIFVNGVEFDTDDAEFVVNGNPASEDALGLGMIVTVHGTLNADGLTGSAERVTFDGAIRGPVESVAVADSEGRRILVVLGERVLVARDATVIEGTTFAALAVGDLVEVSGYREASGQLLATRVERLEEFVPARSEVERSGVVAALGDTTFELDELTVDFAGADLSALPGASVQEGLRVVVVGTLSDSVITASRVGPAPDLRTGLDVDAQLVVQGVITRYRGPGDFRVDGVPVDASQAVLEAGVDTLTDGLLVQVSGRWDGMTLRAEDLQARQGEVLVAAPLVSVESDGTTIVLDILGAAVSIATSAITAIDDATARTDRLSLAALAVNDYLVVEAVARGQSLHGLRVTRSFPRDSAIRGVAELIEPGGSFTVVGVTVETGSANFLDRDGTPLTARAFYDRLRPGDLVLAVDQAPVEGTADSVRLQSTTDSGG